MKTVCIASISVIPALVILIIDSRILLPALPVSSLRLLTAVCIASALMPAPSAAKPTRVILSPYCPAASVNSNIESFMPLATSMNVCAAITSPALPSPSIASPVSRTASSSSNAPAVASSNGILPRFAPVSINLSTSSVLIPSVSANASTVVLSILATAS